MKKVSAALAVGLALSLSGCLNTREQLAKRDDADCRSYGAKPGTQEYFQCRMAKDRNNTVAEAAAAAQSQSAISNFNNTVQNNAVPPSAYNVPPMVPIGRRSGQSCISQPSGNGFVTNCN